MQVSFSSSKGVAVTNLNRVVRKQLSRFGVLLALLLTAACQSQERVVLTAIPTLSPTPRSTPLPVIPTSIPPGQGANPLQIMLVPAGGIEEAGAETVDLAAAIEDETGLVVEFQLVEQSAQALAALCDPVAEVVSVAWLDGMAYSVARSLDCGQSLLQVERGRGAESHTGKASSIIARKPLSIDQMSELDGRRFCRINYADSLSWLVPSVMMNKEGFLVTELRSVSDFADTETIIDALIRGECDAAGVPADTLERLAEQLGDDLENVTVVATSPEVPYTILVAPSELPLSIQEQLTDGLRKLAQDRNLSQKLELLLNQSALEVADDGDFGDFVEFVTSAGLDFTQLGN